VVAVVAVAVVAALIQLQAQQSHLNLQKYVAQAFVLTHHFPLQLLQLSPGILGMARLPAGV
jgi:hypothetical protein